MSSFFTASASQRKRKRQDAPSAPASKKRGLASSGASKSQARQPTRRSAADEDDESISGSESDEKDTRRGARRGSAEEESDSDDAEETAAERRLKLAERYLENIRAEVGEGQEVGFDATDVDRDLIASRLKEDVDEEQGRMYRYIASEIDYSRGTHTFFRADTLAMNGVAVYPPYAYTVSKDMTLIKWELAASPHAAATEQRMGKKQGKTKPMRRQPKQLIYTKGNKNKALDPSYQHHTASILCVAASTTGKFVVTGGADRKLIVWDAATLTPLKVFTHHRDAVTSLAFRGKTHQLFSGSKDRSVKIWSLDELAYVETLFGHADEVVDVAAVGGSEERCVSVGARDRSARLWKVVEESQLVFRGGGGGGGNRPQQHRGVQPLSDSTLPAEPPRFSEGSLDRVLQLSTSLFITGSDSGALSLFALHKKKPLHVLSLAHGYDPAIPASESSAEVDLEAHGGSRAGPTSRWITAMAGIPYSDLFVTGSWDGCVRVWRVVEEGKGKGRIERVGLLGGGGGGFIADTNGDDAHADITMGSDETPGTIRGIINDLAAFERGERGRDGICVVAAVGTETRLGRWVTKKGKNGAVVFEVPRKLLSNGVLVEVGDKA